jgi:hypothetical protein
MVLNLDRISFQIPMSLDQISISLRLESWSCTKIAPLCAFNEFKLLFFFKKKNASWSYYDPGLVLMLVNVLYDY